jgi:hypothetical protein
MDKFEFIYILLIVNDNGINIIRYIVDVLSFQFVCGLLNHCRKEAVQKVDMEEIDSYSNQHEVVFQFPQIRKTLIPTS